MKKEKPFNRKLLKALVVSGVVVIAAVNPFFGILAAHVAREEFQKRKWKQIQDDLYYLKKKGFIKAKRLADGSYVVRTTSVGIEQAKRNEIDDIFINIPRKWDKRWRFVVFDIPAEKQKTRFVLLAKLKELGFIMLQKSVWAHPFECQNEIDSLTAILEIDEHVQQLTCDKISKGAEEHLKDEFKNRNNITLV